MIDVAYSLGTGDSLDIEMFSFDANVFCIELFLGDSCRLQTSVYTIFYYAGYFISKSKSFCSHNAEHHPD